MNTRITLAALTAMALCLATGLLAAPPGGKGGHKPGGGDKPPADIVYLSDDSSTAALTQAAIRGIALTANGTAGLDLSLRKSKAGRDYLNIAMSPDGKQMAWLETGLGMVSTPTSIMVGAPGSKGSAIYTSTWGDGKPYLGRGPDTLAWGRDCGDPTASVLVFATYSPFGIFAMRFVDDQVIGPIALMVLETGQGLWVFPGAFAFSPSGQHLAFGGSGPDGSYGLWLLPMCADYPAVPGKLRSYSFVNGEPPITSGDWSRRGDRLALSVTTGPDPDFPWRDIEIVYLDYKSPGNNSGNEEVTFSSSRWLDLDYLFTAESSEHSPQWGPSAEGAACQRLAFSQSSDIAPRSLYLLDVGAADGSGGPCDVTVPLGISAQYPRALDWK